MIFGIRTGAGDYIMILGTLSLLSRVADAKLDKTSLSTDAATGPRIHYIIPCFPNLLKPAGNLPA